jgi:uncharacterized protein
LVRGRAYPMFAFLFGYGIVQLLRRLTSTGVDEATVVQLVRRRGTWMVLIGFCHALLLFSGDIIGAYGLLAVLLAELLIRARDRTLLIMRGLWTVPIVLFRTLESRLSPLPGYSTSRTPPPVPAACRSTRRGTGRCRGLWRAPRGGTPVRGGGRDRGLVQTLTGFADGLGYAAIAGLLAIRVQQRDRTGLVIGALAASGQRAAVDDLLPAAVDGVRRGAGRIRRWPR